MDYTQQQYFGGAQPYAQFMGIPPLTPSNSHSAGSEDFNNTSPPVSGRRICGTLSWTFASSAVSALYSVFAAGRPGHVSPAPVPLTKTSPSQEAFENFPNDQQYQAFDNGFSQHFNQPGFPGPPTPPNQTNQAGQPVLNGGSQAVKQLPLDGMVVGKAEPGVDGDAQQKLLAQQARSRASNSDDEDLTPAQSRRKAQNRAA